MAKILITGGTGLLGQAITNQLLKNGHQVVFLSTRKKYHQKDVEVFYWNIEEQFIEEAAFDGVDTVIHLAGTSVAGKRWTDEVKNDIIDSRVNTTELLLTYINKVGKKLTTFIGASAIGIYGGDSVGILKEQSPKGADFLAEVCKKWEAQYDLPNEIRKVVFRIGIVLAKEGGALTEMMKTLPFFVGVLGNGKQIYSWIHIDDLANAFVHAVEQEKMAGTFNLVSPNTCSQKMIAQEIAQVKNSFTVPTPKLALQLVLGEMSQVVLMSQNCCAEKLLATGFQFSYPKIDVAIKNLLE